MLHVNTLKNNYMLFILVLFYMVVEIDQTTIFKRRHKFLIYLPQPFICSL